MHGVIGVTNYARNRHGRKRKQRITLSGKAAAIEPRVNYAALAELQPHRRDLPERFRGDDRAGTVLGELLLMGWLEPHDRGGKLSERAICLYQAGRRFVTVVSRYHTMIGTPMTGAVFGNPGSEYLCLGERACGLDPKGKRITPCECLQRTKDYDGAHDALSEAGRPLLIAIKRVVVHDEPCPDNMLPALRVGLGVLDKHFGRKP